MSVSDWGFLGFLVGLGLFSIGVLLDGGDETPSEDIKRIMAHVIRQEELNRRR